MNKIKIDVGCFRRGIFKQKGEGVGGMERCRCFLSAVEEIESRRISYLHKINYGPCTHGPETLKRVIKSRKM
jgi:hypothetical protein